MQKISLFIILAMTILMACQNTPTSKDATHAEGHHSDSGTSCYELRQGADLTAIELSLNGSKVSGYYAWEPHQKDGARGMFKGQKEGDQITAIFEFMIEGSIQSEEVLFKMEGDKLLQASNELEEKGGVLMIKDKSKLNWKDSFSKTDCSKVEEAIGHAKEVYQMITKEKGN